MKHKVLTVKQPWSFLICAGIKPVENRTWKTNYRGRVLIHASGNSITFKQFCNYIENLDSENMELQKIVRENCFRKSWLHTLETSAIIGSVEIVDCVLNHPSIWAEKSEPGQCEITGEWIKPIYNWVLENPILFDEPILNVKGKLGFWDYDLPEEYDKHKQKQALIDMMRGDEELGLYDDKAKNH